MQALSLKTLQRWTQGFRSPVRRLMYRLPFSGAIKPPKGFLVSTEAEYDASQYFVLHSAHTISRTKPKTLGNDIDREFANRLEYNSPATFIAVIPDGRVAGHSVITSDDYLLADVSIEATVLPKNAEKHSIFKSAFLPPIRHVPGHIAVLSAAHCENNYFHWMFNLLPRIELLRHGGFDISNIDAFVVNNSTLSFQKETLALLGISNLLDGKANPHIQADVLIVPSLPGVMGDIPKWVCNFLRREFLKPWERSEVTHPKLIYIRRKNAKYRKLAKEDTLIGLVKDHGFEVFELESLKFQEQVSLFNSARVVVAPHGAGLTNLVFCNPGTKVIEMFSPKYVNGCYWALSNHVELDYYYLLGEGERPQEDLSHSGGGDKYEIDKTKMVSLLNTVMDKM
ncbi:MAG: glycosyltransferase family 61 protein [Abditibacteriaceae bacterium]